jgi:hypothetical protein
MTMFFLGDFHEHQHEAAEDAEGDYRFGHVEGMPLSVRA